MDYLISILSCLIAYSIALSLLYHFFDVTCEKRFPDKGSYYRTGCIISGILIMLTSAWDLKLIRFELYLIYCLFCSSVLFYRKKGNSLLWGGVYGVVSILSYHFIYSGVTALIRQYNAGLFMDKDIYPVIVTSAAILFLICYRIVMILYSCFHGNMPTLMEIISFLMINTFSLGFLWLTLFFHDSYCGNEKYEILVIIMLLGLVQINIYFLSYASFMTRNNVLKRKLSFAETKNIISYEYYRTLEKNYSDCRKVLHDVQNHMQVLEALYRLGNIEATESYASTMANVIEEIYPRSYSDNNMLNIILHDKEKKARDYGIEMNYEVENVNIGFISDYDLATILCNLFDNAITECKKLEKQKRKIQFKLRKVNEFIVLCMENEISSSMEKEREKKLFFRKVEFGIGLNNVKKVVRKHNGSCSIDVLEEKFRVSIYFCV